VKIKDAVIAGEWRNCCWLQHACR